MKQENIKLPGAATVQPQRRRKTQTFPHGQDIDQGFVLHDVPKHRHPLRFGTKGNVVHFHTTRVPARVLSTRNDVLEGTEREQRGVLAYWAVWPVLETPTAYLKTMFGNNYRRFQN